MTRTRYGRALATILISGVVAACIPGQKAYWDARVNEACAKDGGITVFETISVTRQEYALLTDAFGRLSPPLEKDAPDNVRVVRKHTSTYLRDTDPVVGRYELAVVRRSDGKVLGTSVMYSRRGGDMPGPGQPSHFSCPETAGDLFSAVIKLREEVK